MKVGQIVCMGSGDTIVKMVSGPWAEFINENREWGSDLQEEYDAWRAYNEKDMEFSEVYCHTPGDVPYWAADKFSYSWSNDVALDAPPMMYKGEYLQAGSVSSIVDFRSIADKEGWDVILDFEGVIY